MNQPSCSSAIQSNPKYEEILHGEPRDSIRSPTRVGKRPDRGSDQCCQRNMPGCRVYNSTINSTHYCIWAVQDSVYRIHRHGGELSYQVQQKI